MGNSQVDKVLNLNDINMAQFAPQYNLFVIIDKIRLCILWIFWFIFILSIVPAVLKLLNVKLNFEDLINTLNIICIICFFVLDIVVENILIPQADSKRRDDFIDNSFGSSFSSNPSIGYFDTMGLQQGLFKAASNLFENCFFTYSLVKAVTIRKTLLPTVVLLSIAVFAYYGFKQVPFALTLLQALFSATVLGNLIKHFILMVRLHSIHDAWITLFQNQDIKSNTEKYRTLIYRYWLQYETLHSRIQAGIPDKIFNKLNPNLTKEWEEIKMRYNIK